MLNWDNETNIGRLQKVAREYPALFEQLAARRSEKRKALWDEGWLYTLSPTGKGLRSVIEALSQSDDRKSRRAAESLRKTIEERYKNNSTAGGDG